MIAPSPDQQHDPTAACDADHCYIHHRDEPATSTAAIVCGECGHCYQDVAELISADAQLRAELELSRLDTDAIVDVLTHAKDDPGRVFRLIPTCPTCAHDF